jgi:hypothetical protein
MGGLPVIAIAHDNNVYGIFSLNDGKGFDVIRFGTRKGLLKGKYTMSHWLNSYPTKK